MGTELLRAGLGAHLPLERANVVSPHTVLAVHRAYRKAGATILTTNTFGANRFRLHGTGYDDEVASLARKGAELARAAAGEALVAGSIGPSGHQDNDVTYEELRAGFREAAEALARGDVDMFSCETFGDVTELRAAIEGIGDVSDRPILAQMTYSPGPRTPLGLTPKEVVQALHDLPIAAIGVNCAIGEVTVREVVAALREASELPLVVRPNAGQPERHGDGWHYPLNPAEFAMLVCDLAPHSSIIGGCCGTTPEYITATHHRLFGL